VASTQTSSAHRALMLAVETLPAPGSLPQPPHEPKRASWFLGPPRSFWRLLSSSRLSSGPMPSVAGGGRGDCFCICGDKIYL